MVGWTNRGKVNVLDERYRATTLPINYYIALVRATTAPTPDTNTLGELTQISTGTGYSDGGFTLNLNSTDFDVLTEDDGNDRALIQIKDVVFTASGGNLDSGAGARHAIFTDHNAVIASREVEHYFDLVSDRNVSTGQTLTLQDLEIRIDES